jgi:5-methylcytosine-specific restriction endonuclease McrA
MDAHHSDPRKKENILSVLLNNPALQRRPRLIAELDECEFMCTRCHQNLHFDPMATHEQGYLLKNKGRKIDARKKKIREIYGERCQECGDWLYPKEMEFHHRNSSEKTALVSDLIRVASEETMLRELAKCDIVCRNCHRLKLETVKAAL